jgi:hypothetical protein
MHTIFYHIANPVGILGVALILFAYFLLSIERMQSNSFIFQFLNFIGAWLILYSLFFHWNLASVIIEIAWVSISALGMWRAVSKPSRDPKGA